MSIVVEHAISLIQPWASLMAIGAKRIETRSWSTRYRGWIAIHASKGFPQDCRAYATERPCCTVLHNSGVRVLRDLPLGCVLAVARVVDCIHTEELDLVPPHLKAEHEGHFGNYEEGRYGFVTEGVRQLREPLPVKGALSIWKLPKPITEDMLLP